MTRDLAKNKQTELALYVTAKQAYQLWMENPEAVKILDVRTPEEYIFIGHPEMAMNIPFGFQTYKFDVKKGYFDMSANPELIDQIRNWSDPDDTILALCRSGIRSAMTADMLAKVGYSRVYNITDGMEGDTVNDEESVYHGKRMQNGWKNSGAPWTYGVDPKLTRYPSGR